MKKLIIKVCGINDLVNHETIATMSIDMIGLNFYPASKRYLTAEIYPRQGVDYVGVFVNAPMTDVRIAAQKYGLHYAQLHGDEDVEYCRELSKEMKIIKAFRITTDFDFNKLHDYAFCAYYLFDTFTAEYGGSGKKFNWDVLKQYTGARPFLLSGGIGIEDYDAITKLDHPLFVGVDINSKFETAPGHKDVELVHHFVQKLRHEKVNV